MAVRVARESGMSVTFVATATPDDEEMAARIARHRAERPPEWTVVEEPVALAGAVGGAADGAALVVDCLSLWVANVMAAGWSDAEVEEEAQEAAVSAAARDALTVAVSNEVGLGIVPVDPLARRYRDVLGRVNAAWAAAADRTAFVVAGMVLPLSPAESVLDD